MSAERGLNPESNQFSKADIENITGNFKRPIGQGGFGTVFHGVLNDGTEVAVKILSKASAHAERQFRAEVNCLDLYRMRDAQWDLKITCLVEFRLNCLPEFTTDI